MANFRSIFKRSASPMYTQVADAMRDRIVKGVWSLNTQIPSLPELANEFGVALVTIRQAIGLLRDEGLLRPAQGKGTFVEKKPQTHPKMRVETSLQNLAELYRKLNPKITPLEDGFGTPNIEIGEGRLGKRYRMLRRVHSRDRQVTSVITAYLDDRIFRLAPSRFRKGLIIPILMDVAGDQIGSAKQVLTVSTAGTTIAKEMNISASAPVAEVRRVFCSHDSTVLYVGELTYRADFIRVEMDLLG